ncbi:hypothetical protein [Citrobacter portucalensis]|uniref:hypothetical protein n=1 Tax=Citrobacter portucalensis TaxID=1639133 RepID=UPI00397BD73F
MSEFKGTPGEWSFSHSSASDDNVACIEINSSESLHEIAYLQSTPSSIGKYEQTYLDKTIANAHLIAAAPELLKALQAVVRVADRQTDEFDMARAAIAKALGK